MAFLRHPLTLRVCRITLGLIFATAALAKLGDLEQFAAQVHNFRIVPIASENLIALTLPWVELVAALALILDIRSRAAALLLTALLAVFTLGVIAAVARGLSFECGCFGKASSTGVGLRKIAENSAMLLVAAVATLRRR